LLACSSQAGGEGGNATISVATIVFRDRMILSLEYATGWHGQLSPQPILSRHAFFATELAGATVNQPGSERSAAKEGVDQFVQRVLLQPS
jgi:hypothetical protein